MQFKHLGNVESLKQATFRWINNIMKFSGSTEIQAGLETNEEDRDVINSLLEYYIFTRSRHMALVIMIRSINIIRGPGY